MPLSHTSPDRYLSAQFKQLFVDGIRKTPPSDTAGSSRSHDRYRPGEAVEFTEAISPTMQPPVCVTAT